MPAGEVWVMREGSIFNAITDPDGTPATVDLSCYVNQVAVTTTANEVTADTMCGPQTLQGTPSRAAAFQIVWSPEAYKAIKALEGQECEFYYQADPNMAVPEGWTWRGKIQNGMTPLGTSDLNAVIVEAVPVSVLSTPDLLAPAP